MQLQRWYTEGLPSPFQHELITASPVRQNGPLVVGESASYLPLRWLCADQL
jgi:hypothetical protein